MGLPVPSVGPQIAECQRVLEKSGLEYKVSRMLYDANVCSCSASRRPLPGCECLLTRSGYGTNIEGPWDKVMEVRRPSCACSLQAIGDCHRAVHAMGTPRIAVSVFYLHELIQDGHPHRHQDGPRHRVGRQRRQDQARRGDSVQGGIE